MNSKSHISLDIYLRRFTIKTKEDIFVLNNEQMKEREERGENRKLVID